MSFGRLADGPLQRLLASSPSLLKLNCITLPTQLSLPTRAVRYPRPSSCFHCYGAVTNASDHPGITHILPTGVTPRGVVITDYLCKHCTILLLQVCKSYTPSKTERRLFLHCEQSCRLVMAEPVELHKYHKLTPCASYRNRDRYGL